LLARDERAELTVVDGNVEARGDDTGLVESSVELDDHLPSSVIIDDLELADVAYKRTKRSEVASRAEEMS